MTPITTLHTSSFSMLSKLILFAILLGTLFISACNLRENALLPPNLDPKDYIIESTIRVYSDHLIKSSNDDAYIYIPKESIADSCLWYNDTLSLEKVSSLTERDSLAFVSATTQATDTYKLTILRNGQEVLLDSIPNFATLYVDAKSASDLSGAEYVQSAWRLSAEDSEIYPYGSSRCFFDIDGNGEIALLNFHSGKSLSIPAGTKDLQALIHSGTDYAWGWFPAETRATAQTLELKDSLLSGQVASIQSIFPGFALNTKVFSLSGATTGSAVPILRYRVSGEKHFDQQWVRLSGANLTTWRSGEETWLYEGNELVTFLKGDGSYFLVTPVTGQNLLDIPLDGSYDQIFLQDLWLDLNDVELSGHRMRLNLAPNTTKLVSDYFSGNPFSLSRAYDAFSIEFLANGAPITSLPEDKWIEYGFSTTQSDPASARLFHAYRSSNTDHLYYKSYANAYDSEHFTQTNGVVYAGYSSSGTYLYGVAGESSTSLTIPCLKENLELQTFRAFLSWADPTLPCTALSLTYSALVPSGNPWLSGNPYTLSNPKSILSLTTVSPKSRADELPTGLFLSLSSPVSVSEIINFSPDVSYPKFVRYRSASAYAHNTFVMSGAKIGISPAYAGYLINGAYLSAAGTTLPLALFSRMVFDDFEREVYLNSTVTMAPGTILQMTPRQSLTDTYGVLASQYDLSGIGPVYSFGVLNNSTFYTNFQPYIRLRQSTRTENMLISIIEGEFYRIYPYEQAETADGWHFSIADGHVAFYLINDGQYAAVHDNNPHSSVDAIMNITTRDFHTSLYQNQFVLPSEYLGTTVPIGSHVTLNTGINPPQGVSPTAICQLLLRNAQLTFLNPGFYTIVGATRLPYLYLAIPNYTAGQTVRLFYRSPLGVTTEFTRVSQFSDAPTGEFLLVGNTAVCFFNNPGIFYTTN